MLTVFRGYDPAQVDAFLARCARTVGARPDLPELSGRGVTGAELVTADEVERVVFDRRFRGYDIEAVDDLLDRVREILL